MLGDFHIHQWYWALLLRGHHAERLLRCYEPSWSRIKRCWIYQMSQLHKRNSVVIYFPFELTCLSVLQEKLFYFLVPGFPPYKVERCLYIMELVTCHISSANVNWCTCYYTSCKLRADKSERRSLSDSCNALIANWLVLFSQNCLHRSYSSRNIWTVCADLLAPPW